MKPLYKVTLNWSGENHIFYTHSNTKNLALSNAIRQLSAKLKILPIVCWAKYKGQSDNFRIEKEN